MTTIFYSDLKFKVLTFYFLIWPSEPYVANCVLSVICVILCLK